MIRSRLAAATALAALLAVPAFAQMSGSASSNTTANSKGSISATAPVPVAPSSTSSSPSSTPSSTTQFNTNAQNKASAARQAAIDQGRTPLCSELHQPNAGKLADKTTGSAAEHSASAVHMDCIPDSPGATSGVNANTGIAANNTASKAKKKPAKTASNSTGQ